MQTAMQTSDLQVWLWVFALATWLLRFNPVKGLSLCNEREREKKATLGCERHQGRITLAVNQVLTFLSLP